MPTHIAMSSVLRNDAAATDTEIPVPSAIYATKQAGHFGSNARISAGNENFANASLRCLSGDGWALPSAALLEKLCVPFGLVWQQFNVLIGDSHYRSRMPFLSAPHSLADSDRDGGPMTC